MPKKPFPMEATRGIDIDLMSIRRKQTVEFPHHFDLFF